MLKALGEVRGEGREKSEGVRWKEGRGGERVGGKWWLGGRKRLLSRQPCSPTAQRARRQSRRWGPRRRCARRAERRRRRQPGRRRRGRREQRRRGRGWPGRRSRSQR